MHRRGRTSEIVDFVHLDIERKRYIVTHQLKALVIAQMLDVTMGTGEEVIGAEYIRIFVEQPLAKMRTKKAGAAGNQHTFLKMHIAPLWRVFAARFPARYGPS